MSLLNNPNNSPNPLPGNKLRKKKMKTKSEFQASERVRRLPPYLFAEIDKMKRALITEGKDVIDLGVGDPDLPTPQFIIDALKRGVEDPQNHRYALDQGLPELRQAIAGWYRERFGVKLDPDTEVLPLLGSKEGIGHMPLAVVNPGDVVIVPDPGYPVYQSSTWFAGGETYITPLLEDKSYLVDFESIEKSVLQQAKKQRDYSCQLK